MINPKDFEINGADMDNLDPEILAELMNGKEEGEDETNE